MDFHVTGILNYRLFPESSKCSNLLMLQAFEERAVPKVKENGTCGLLWRKILNETICIHIDPRFVSDNRDGACTGVYASPHRRGGCCSPSAAGL